MSLSAQKEFIASVEKSYDHFSLYLELKKPSFETKGFLSIAKMEAVGGIIEILYGPPEYRAELFINCHRNHKKWGLSALFQIKNVTSWLKTYRPKTKKQSKIEADVECFFHLVTEGVHGIDEFAWLHKRLL